MVEVIAMKKSVIRLALGVVTLLSTFVFTQNTKVDHVSANNVPTAKLRFEVSLPASAKQAFDGRLLLLISTNNNQEPRLQINEDLNTQQVFGVDVDGWKLGQAVKIDENAFGYPPVVSKA
jgi:hypothetical protein